MKLLANIFVFFVAISHVGILVLEMFFLESPNRPKNIFNDT
jgi:uncharacterized membrane protein